MKKRSWVYDLNIKSALVWLWVFVFFMGLRGVGNAGLLRDWEKEWETTLPAAKKEGKVVLYSHENYIGVFQEFQRKYPEINVMVVPGLGSQITQRIMAERRAGKYLADVFISGGGTAYLLHSRGNAFDPLKPALILPEVVDESRWWAGKHKYVDEKGEYIFTFFGNPAPFFGYNTKLVNPNEIKSYWDFLNPKWKGKIVALDPTLSVNVGPYLTFLYYTPELGPPYIRRLLGEMDLAASRNVNQIVDWLAVGKYAISAFTNPGRTGLFDAKEQGLPVTSFGPENFKEGIPVTAATGNLALFNKAAHPNAARVAVNWLLSREGQMVSQKLVDRANSLRIDIPKDGVDRYTQLVKGGRYLDVYRPEWSDMTPIFKVVKEVWKK